MVQRPLLALPNLHLQRKQVYLRALEPYAANPELEFPDVLSVAYTGRARNGVVAVDTTRTFVRTGETAGHLDSYATR